jgi:hypothetical protein
MYRRKRRNKRSDDMMDITFKTVVLALRLSGIEYRKMYFPSQLPSLSVAVRKKMCMAARKKMSMRKMHVVEKNPNEMSTRTKRIKCTVIVDHQCWTQ